MGVTCCSLGHEYGSNPTSTSTRRGNTVRAQFDLHRLGKHSSLFPGSQFRPPRQHVATKHNMDPYKSTRKEYTDKALSMPIPRDSTKEWENMVQILRTLYRLLAFHPAMATNINDTYMTPARTKNKVYFMWDFIGRTLVFRGPELCTYACFI